MGEGDVVRKIFVLSVLSVFVSACAINSVEDYPVRSPKNFLIDVKAVVDSGDLENVGFVAKRLRIDYKVDLREPVRDRNGSIEGYGVDVKRIASSKEYEKKRGFDYGIFWPVKGEFYRAGLSLPIDAGAICITPYDLLEVFGDVEKYPVSHRTWWAYMYERKDIDARVVFSIDRGGCISGVYISMNRERK
ncbi:hypothetical protein ACJ51O_29780 [Burkholderia pyrrocinia]|uniref:hypothetical protein n=1 Tax=Burkholderia pyrrocinia TaxID=60550 RepID=UPI0038B504C8